MSTYTKVNDNLHYVKMASSEISLRYWDQAKRTTTYSNYFNAGFFGCYGSDYHTLPVANLVCDIDVSTVPDAYEAELLGWGCTISGGKLFKGCNNGPGFTGKIVSTFYVDQYNNCYISRIYNVGTAMKCAVSGPPVMKSGAKTTYNNDCLNEGWDNTWYYNTWHGLLCTTSNNKECYYVAMKTTTTNCIDTAEAYNTLNSLGLGITNAIMLDGGGSFILKRNGSEVAGTTENRRINTIGLY